VTVIFCTQLLSCIAKWLARESSANNIDWPDICGCEGSDIAKAGDFRPMLCEDGPWVWLNLAKGDGAESSRSLKAETESADAGK